MAFLRQFLIGQEAQNLSGENMNSFYWKTSLQRATFEKKAGTVKLGVDFICHACIPEMIFILSCDKSCTHVVESKLVKVHGLILSNFTAICYCLRMS